MGLLRFAVFSAILFTACGRLDERQSLTIQGYTVTEASDTPTLYRNVANGYQVTIPPGLELHEHRNGHYVIVPSHGTLFGIWMHAETTDEQARGELLGELGRRCNEHPASAKERAENGGALRLVPVRRGPFEGYKAVPTGLPDATPARLFAFRSPRQDGWFGFDLTPEHAEALFASLAPLAPAAPRPR